MAASKNSRFLNPWTDQELKTLRSFMRQPGLSRRAQAKAFCRAGSKRSLSAVSQRVHLLLKADKNAETLGKMQGDFVIKLSKKQDAPKPQQLVTATFGGVQVKGPANTVLKQLSALKVKEAHIKFS